MKQTRGFTIVELLTVMAIIAVLMGISVPVFLRARSNANRSADMANMNILRTALQVYHADHGRYPPALLGYVTPYMSESMKSIPPAEKIWGLYPRRVSNVEIYKPVTSRAARNLSELTSARYPYKNSLARLADQQAFGPEDGFVAYSNSPIKELPKKQNDPKVVGFYKVSGYDVAEVPILDPVTKKNRMELRYTRFWTKYALQEGGSANDDPRQLGYANPPEDTVVTWDSYFRTWETKSGKKIPKDADNDIILFLSGSATLYNSRKLFEENWAAKPK